MELNMMENQLLLMGKLLTYYVNSPMELRILIDNPWGTDIQMGI